MNKNKTFPCKKSTVIAASQGCRKRYLSGLEDTTLMTIDAFVAQTRKLAEHLKIKDVILYGHSWGAMLAVEYFDEYPKL